MKAWLEGNKTYLTAGAIGLVAMLHALGVIDDKTYDTLLGLLGAGGLAFLRRGVKKVEEKV